jgi:hypothetical protein
MKKIIVGLVLCCLVFLMAGCTSFVTASGNSKVITTITQRNFGINISTATTANQTPQITLGWLSTTVQFMPLSTNGVLTAPNYSSTFSIGQNASPFSFDGNEDMASGDYAVYEPDGTNTLAAQPQAPK